MSEMNNSPAFRTSFFKSLFVAIGLFAATSVVSANGGHELFDRVLSAHVSAGRVDYPAIASDPRFEQYIQQLGQTNPDSLPTREDKLAYWINAYNAFAIKGILEDSSPSSFFGRIGYFKNRTYNAGGRDINLYDLERKVLIPMGEPRIHFAIVCASMSCPGLRPEAYTAARLDQQLDDNARAFINDDFKNNFDTTGKVANISKIFDWFNEDFEKHSGSVSRYISQFVSDPAVAQALSNETYAIKHLSYDWNLNGIPPKG